MFSNEVISNSMDAGATSVEIKLDLPRYRLSISDNGRGIPAEKLQSLVATAQGVKNVKQDPPPFPTWYTWPPRCIGFMSSISDAFVELDRAPR